jgi:hypothetical protein
MRQINTIETLLGGAELVGGFLRNTHLDMLSDEVRDKRDKLKTARDAVDAYLDSAEKTGIVESVKLARLQADVDNRTHDALQAQAYLDREQNRAELWRMGSGIAHIASGLGVGQGQGPTQVPAGAVVLDGQVFVPLALGLAGGFAASAIASRSTTQDNRP